MVKIRNPILFSEYYGIDAVELDILGILDPTLNVDTKLFIDPLLLKSSKHPEIAKSARATYEKHFGMVIKFLSKTKTMSDVAWKAAERLLSFPEVKWTCLGYGAQSVSGSGSGVYMTTQYIETARQIVELGIDDPDLFVAMALFEDGVGPDRISDMTTNVILKDLLNLNERILSEINVPTKEIKISLKNGRYYTAKLAINPYVGKHDPVILVPTDVLRHLPMATDWSEVADAASKNLELRNRVSRQIAQIWRVKSRQDKAAIRQWALSGKDSFETFLYMLRSANPEPYDLSSDPRGEVFWRKLAARLAYNEPLKIKPPLRMDLVGVEEIVEKIIDQYRFLIEDRRYSAELYHNGIPRRENAAQKLFFAVAYAYCKANKLDITPEAETGNGPVDFKISSGFNGRVVVEIKLSKNPKLIAGYTKQLATYKKAEQTQSGYYVVVDVGGMGNKADKLLKIKNDAAAKGEHVSPIIFIDGSQKASASKL